MREEQRFKIFERLTDGFEKELFAAALENLENKGGRLRFNNFAYAIRELVDHVLKRRAPDNEVVRCSWYRRDQEATREVTRRQRVYYMVQGGLSDEYVRTKLETDIDSVHTVLREAVEQLNRHTHINEKTFNVAATAVEALVDETASAIIGLFDAIDGNREALINALAEQLDTAVVDEALRETIVSIDALASHHSVDEVYTGKVLITSIDSRVISFEARGTIACTLQYGSNSDLRRGDGAEISESFSFVCQLRSPVDEPEDIEADENSFGVDTEAYERARYGLDERESED